MSESDPGKPSAVTDDWGTGTSRPSKTNCTTAEDGPTPSKTGAWRTQYWKRKNELVDEFVENWSNRAARPVSVREGLLREEATREKHEEGSYRAANWRSVLNSFLMWYNDYRYAHLKFTDPDGETVRGSMPNSHQPRYGDKYYARLKALEREMLKQYATPTVVMLTFTGSMKNARGGWRCPADHLRDVIDAWRPDEGRGVYHALRDVLDIEAVDAWEYALVTEQHKNGYGHVHCAVFVDGDVSEEDFHPVIDAHLAECSIAGRDAHDYHDPDPDARPISVRDVDPDLDPEDYDRNAEDVPDDLGNVASYIGDYVGSFGEPLFERNLDELTFRSVAWATGTQRVRFSTGANEMIDADRGADDDDDLADDPVVLPNPEFDPDEHATAESDVSPFEVQNAGWSIEAISRVTKEGEEDHEVKRSGVQWDKINDSSHLDPRAEQPPDRPRRRTDDATLTAY